MQRNMSGITCRIIAGSPRSAGLWLAAWLLPFTLWAGPRTAQWQQVDNALRRGLPRTAITNLEPIIEGALKDKAYAEAAKAIGQKIVLEGNLQGGQSDERIRRLTAAIAQAPREMVPVLDTLLAHWYWQYYLQNNWRFLQRTATSEAPGKDLATWDLRRLFGEIDRQFQKALADAPRLQKTPVGAWTGFLTPGNMPDAYRPTLYDVLVHEALDFYASGEQAGARPEDAFELTTAAPVFEPVDRFLAWQPAAGGDTESPVRTALRLYQDLLRFHRHDPAPALALADADLDRLVWAANTATGEDKDARYQAALGQFESTYADFEICALAFHRHAAIREREGDLVGAHQLAERGARLYPQSPGGKLCRNQLTALEAKSLGLSTERVWNAAGPKIEVRFRNLQKVYFRAVRYDWNVFLQKQHNRPENLNPAEQREVLAQAPAFEWSESLPAPADYREHRQELPAPAKLAPGFYFIIASADPGFGEKENQVAMTHVWVSRLALVTRAREDRLEGLLLDAISGEPIAGAEIAVWHLNANGERVSDPTRSTDTNGWFTVYAERNRGYLFRARYQREELATAEDLAAVLWDEPMAPQPVAQTVFFTDRALYRPGQTIQYKGICVRLDQQKDRYEVLPGETVKVLFQDENGKTIAEQAQRANDYGSFAGNFTAPRDRLMGRMIIRAEGRAPGGTSVSVEEYKRPKFETVLEAPKTGARLNELVHLSGRATSYTGAAVDGAQVRYRVQREVRMPWWWGRWGRPWPGSGSQEIAHGQTRTGADGTFNVEFKAKPDLKVPERDEPTFVYSVTADVTDPAGETRSAVQHIRVGYAALEATLSADDWQTEAKPVELQIQAQTLDAQPQVAEGRVLVYALQAPVKVQRPPLEPAMPWGFRGRYPMPGPENADADQPSNEADPNNWPLGQVAAQQAFATGTNGTARLTFKLAAGAYRAIIETQDRFGRKITGKLPLQVLKPEDTRLAIRIPHLLAAPTWETQPGDEFLALWGTGYDAGRALVEIEHRRRILQRYWTKPGQTQQQIKLAVTEAMRGGFTLHVTYVRENRAWLDSRKIEVPWKNQELDLRWEHFVSKLEPGKKETWSLTVKPSQLPASQVERQFAEVVATLYDESLDAFLPHSWIREFSGYREDAASINAVFGNALLGFAVVRDGWSVRYESARVEYRTFPPGLGGHGGYGRARFQYDTMGGMGGGEPAMVAAPMFKSVPARLGTTVNAVADSAALSEGLTPLRAGRPVESPPVSPPKPDLSRVTARQNLNETAFFFPQLTTDSNGLVRLTFTMPEALTKWHFMGFAHDRAMRSGFLEGHAVTAKDLMVQPNPPRFLREGDTVEFSVKVSNQSDQAQTGEVRLNFKNALTDQPADTALGNHHPTLNFTIPAKESRAFAWKITVPDGCGFLSYQAVGATAKFSDGEAGAVPVLSRRILVTESLPLPIRGPATKKFTFTRLLDSGKSKTLQSQGLTVQMVSNPAWYAVLALPYLIEYPYECSEQVFNRLYANSLARSIANQDPRIRRIFDQWKNTPALASPLEKNQDLKQVLIEETPWLRSADSESQARQQVGLLFDGNRLDYETRAALKKLTEMQLGDGAWPWFPGGRGNDYITLYVTTGFGRLRHLGVDIEVGPALRSLGRLDEWMAESYRHIQTLPDPDKYVPNPTDALYLYGRSFFLKDHPIAAPQQKAVDFFLAQARQHWLSTGNRQTQAQLAIALQRFGAGNPTPDPTPRAILASLKERSVSDEELGMFWREDGLSWWWYRAPIETQALMIEAFDEVAHDAAAVEACKVWLLKQKQTQDWKTTKATADAVYALLLRGRDLLASAALVDVSLGGKSVTPSPSTPAQPGRAGTVEPGTGFYEVRFAPPDIKPKLGEILVRKTDEGVAWGSVHWQYLEDMAKVTPYAGTPLKLKKTLFRKTDTAKGPVLEPIRNALHVGDELVVRLELRVDRDMEYVHLKDQRGSGTEPVNVLSGYRYQDGLGYYESTRDTASHFFIDYLRAGTYVFEYSTRVQLRGRYQSGVAAIQCLYAPEFNSHSESVALAVE